MRCAWATLPTCTSRGLCAYQRVNAHVQGFAYKRHSTTDTTAPKTQTTSPTTPRFHRFSPRWSALWAPHHLKPRRHRLQTGGIARHEAPTRRRHAARGLHVVQNPTATSMEGTGGTAGPGRGTRGRRGLVGQRPTRRSKRAARTAEAGGTHTTASQISHVIYRGHFSRCPENVGIPGL